MRASGLAQRHGRGIGFNSCMHGDGSMDGTSNLTGGATTSKEVMAGVAVSFSGCLQEVSSLARGARGMWHFEDRLKCSTDRPVLSSFFGVDSKRCYT